MKRPMQACLDDYDLGERQSRYFDAELPSTTFPDKSLDVRPILLARFRSCTPRRIPTPGVLPVVSMDFHSLLGPHHPAMIWQISPPPGTNAHKKILEEPGCCMHEISPRFRLLSNAHMIRKCSRDDTPGYRLLRIAQNGNKRAVPAVPTNRTCCLTQVFKCFRS